LNVALETTAAINIFGDWNHSASLAPMVLMESGEKTTAPWAVVSVELDALALLEQAAAQAAEHVDVEESITSKPEIEAAAAKPNVEEKSFIAKGLDDSEEPRLRFRLDSAHASATPAPHAKFKLQPQELVNKAGADIAPEITPEPANLESPDEAATTSTIPAPPQSAPSQSEVHKVAELGLDESQLDLAEPFDLTFAESSLEPLDNELVSSLELDNASASASDRASGPAGINRTASPLWEVDKFHWPRTCEKLFADDQGYLSRAGDKLLAAVQDGLRVLAITGTRRGEGRTTLALCLARSAAQAGIQVAVMDADFARPQLASKIALEVAFGWQDAALGNIPLSEAAVKSISDRVTVLPLESAAATRALSMADPRVTATIRAAAATFELLILDLGPIGSGEQLAFPPGEGCPFDAAIVVRDLRFATATESENVGEALQEAGVEAVGIAENFVVEDEIPATSV
jgi:Mrp family chromosome partitioning ATPase